MYLCAPNLRVGKSDAVRKFKLLINTIIVPHCGGLGVSFFGL